MPRKASPSGETQRARLRVSRAEAKEKVQVQIAKGEAMRKPKAWNSQLYEKALEEYDRWDTFNGHLLESLFTTDRFARDYHLDYGGGATYTSLTDKISGLIEDIRDSIGRLQIVCDAIDVTDEDVTVHPRATVPTPQKVKVSSNKVFIVHGHDEAAKHSAARLLTKLKLEPIILGEQDDLGRTIIEKFEDYSDVDFAIVLLTPDDVGASVKEFADREQDGLMKRARQNVIFEMGFFFGKLGRKHVCALLKSNTERPSDISGIVYTPMDDHGAWETKLAKEMKSAGLPVNMEDL